MNELVVPVNETDNIAGSPDAPVVLVEYGDFECPHCGRAHPILQDVQRALGDRLALVYRNFPLTEVHPHALLAAEAAEAAAAQGQFWAMHDTLFEHQDAMEPDDIVDYADSLALDVPRFERDVSTRKYEGKVRNDFRGGVRSGVNGTPTFFVNGARFDGDWSDVEGFTAMLAEAARAHSSR